MSAWAAVHHSYSSPTSNTTTSLPDTEKCASSHCNLDPYAFHFLFFTPCILLSHMISPCRYDSISHLDSSAHMRIRILVSSSMLSTLFLRSSFTLLCSSFILLAATSL